MRSGTARAALVVSAPFFTQTEGKKSLIWRLRACGQMAGTDGGKGEQMPLRDYMILTLTAAAAIQDYFTGKVDVGIILTMNAPKSFYNLAYRKKAKEVAQSFKELNGSVELCACCDTLQVADYSKYSMASFNEEHKRAMREKQFPKDLAKAFQLGAMLSAEK